MKQVRNDTPFDYSEQFSLLAQGIADCANNWLCGPGVRQVVICNQPEAAAAVIFKGECAACEASLILRRDGADGFLLTARSGKETYRASNFEAFEADLKREKQRKEIGFKEILELVLIEDFEIGRESKTALTQKENRFCSLLCEQLGTLGYDFTRGDTEVLDEMLGRLHVPFHGPNSDIGDPSVSFYVSRDSETHRYEISNKHGDGGVFSDLSELATWFAQRVNQR